jgi:hypothetical protein
VPVGQRLPALHFDMLKRGKIKTVERFRKPFFSSLKIGPDADFPITRNQGKS